MEINIVGSRGYFFLWCIYREIEIFLTSEADKSCNKRPYLLGKARHCSNSQAILRYHELGDFSKRLRIATGQRRSLSLFLRQLCLLSLHRKCGQCSLAGEAILILLLIKVKRKYYFYPNDYIVSEDIKLKTKKHIKIVKKFQFLGK